MKFKNHLAEIVIIFDLIFIANLGWLAGTWGGSVLYMGDLVWNKLPSLFIFCLVIGSATGVLMFLINKFLCKKTNKWRSLYLPLAAPANAVLGALIFIIQIILS